MFEFSDCNVNRSVEDRVIISIWHNKTVSL